MATFFIIGLMLLIAFLCISQSIPEMTHRKHVRSGGSSGRARRESKK